jgi:hypothetical protein
MARNPPTLLFSLLPAGYHRRQSLKGIIKIKSVDLAAFLGRPLARHV